jgi:hypothetical protein
MKISWTSLKISIAGAKLSHLVQKDKIWDHGSMAEQVRIIFYLVQKELNNENIESLKKHCTISCFEKLKTAISKEGRHQEVLIKNPIIKEIAVTEVHPGKNNKPDMFTALIKGVSKDTTAHNDYGSEFSATYSFSRQGDWWLLDGMKTRLHYLKHN